MTVYYMRRGRHSRQREQDVQRPSGRRERGEYKGGEESDCGYVTSGKCAGEIGVGWLRGTSWGYTGSFTSILMVRSC